MMADARTAAFNVLFSVENDKAYSNIALNRTVRENDLTGADAAFASALVYGVLERKITLDYIIRQYTKKTPLSKIETKTLIILRMGVLQLIFMDKIPESAAVNESVKLAKRLRLYKTMGFINAVLRSIIRAGRAYVLPEENTSERLSVEYSCPIRLIELWIRDYGRENTLKILASLNGRPPIHIRVNTLKTDSADLIKRLEKENVRAVQSPILPFALEISQTGSVERLEPFQNGDFYVQDISSQLCTHFLRPEPGQTVLDVCAAPGGKSFGSAMLMNDCGKIFSCDIHEHKLKLIEDSARRLGITSVNTVMRDALSDISPVPSVDRVLCDVPCSGLGILRRKPEIRYKKDWGIDNLANLQYDILSNNAKFVKPGGILVYSTCTLNRRENNLNADRFLEENRNFKPDPIIFPREISEKENQLTLFPGRDGHDGFFIAAFRRRM